MIVNGIYVQRIFSDIFIESKKNVKGNSIKNIVISL